MSLSPEPARLGKRREKREQQNGMAKLTDWKSLVALALAASGVAFAAVVLVRKMREDGKGVEGMIDDAIDFCKDKSDELQKLIEEAEPAT